MRIRKHWIGLLIILTCWLPGSQAPKIVKVAGTVVTQKGSRFLRELCSSAVLWQTSTSGRFTISAPAGENKAVLLVKGYRPQIVPLTLSEESQTLTLT